MKDTFKVIIDGNPGVLLYVETDGKKTLYASDIGTSTVDRTHFFPFGKGPATWLKGQQINANGHTYLLNE